VAQVHNDQGRPLVKIEDCGIFFTGEPGTLYIHTGGSFTGTASLTHDFRRFKDLAKVFTQSTSGVDAGSPVGKILCATNMGAIFDRFGVWSERGARMVRTEEPARYMIDGHHVVHAETLYGSNHIKEEINKDPIRCIMEFLILRAE